MLKRVRKLALLAAGDENGRFVEEEEEFEIGNWMIKGWRN
jgi:hypothetical protein